MAGERRTLRELVAAVAVVEPDRPALVAVDGSVVPYGRLLAAIDATGATLRSVGVERADDVAVLAPNGVEMAMAFLGVGSAAVCAPLNPVSTEAELAFSLDDLTPAAVVVAPELEPRIRGLAEARGIPLLDLSIVDGGDGVSGPAVPEPEPDDVALVLHTSGTTARPKQVPLSHGNLCRSAHNVAETLGLGPSDRCLNVMPLFHIHGLVAALCASLAAGASVVCTPGFDPRRFRDWTAQQGPTWYSAVPTIHQAVLAVDWPPSGPGPKGLFRFVRSSSAALPTTVLADLEAHFGCPVIEAYGMTEAAHQMASNPLPPGVRKPGTVGRATGLEIAVVDEVGRPVATGAVGEIVIRGDNVMQGYRDPAADLDAFVDGWFRTGDQGSLDEDGYLTIRSRLKELVNRGGEKIAPREVEEALLRHPAVGEALVFAVPHPTLGEDVGAAVVPAAEGAPDPGELRRFLSQDLAAFKVPRSILVVDALPRGATGKPQRVGAAERLGVSAADRASAHRSQDDAGSALEVALAALWARVLGVETIGLDDDFFASGGDSLSAAELVVQVLEVCRVALPVSSVFDEASTVSGMAELVRRTVVEVGGARGSYHPDEPGRLSSAQERLWFLHAFEPADVAYNEHLAVRMEGPLDVRALAAALTAVEGRHETLRTSFALDGGRPRAVVHEPCLELAVVDLSDADDPASMLRERSSRLLRRPFDLAAGPPVRAHLLRASPTDHLFLLSYHHVVADGRSRELVREELVQLYEEIVGGGTPDPTGPPGRYADVAAHEQSHFASPAFQRELDHWRGVLADLPAPLELPADHPRPARQPTEVGRFGTPTGEELRDELSKLAAYEGATLFMTTLAAFVALVHRHTGRTDIIVGVPVAGRHLADWADVVGPFVNTLAVRVDLSGRLSFRTLLARVRAATLAALDHQNVPFERLVQELHPDRDVRYPPLVQVLFQLRSRPLTTARARGLRLRDVRLAPSGAKFDLVVDLEDNGRRLRTTLEYASELFERSSAEDLLARYHGLLGAVIADPDLPIGELPLLTPMDRERLASYRHGPRRRVETVGLHELVERRAAEDPTAVAVLDGGRSHTRGELDEDANRLSHHLRDIGVRPSERVGVCLERSAGAIIAALAVLKCGATVVPLDPSYPEARLHLMLDDAEVGALVTTTLLAERLGRSGAVVRIDDHDELRRIEARPTTPVGFTGPFEAAATLIFTSGSTGRPKAVLGTHRGVVNRLAWAERAHPFAPGDVGAARAPISFVDSVAETFGPLVGGVPLVVVPEDVARDPRLLTDLLRVERVTRLLVVPSLLRGLLAAVPDLDEQLPDLRLWITSGEPLTVELARRFFAALPGRTLLNLYGSTEVAADATALALTEAPGPGAWEVPIGRPIDNTDARVVDGDGREVPPGVVGELMIGGAGVALGYRGDDRLTAARFVDGGYRTGDLACWGCDGNLRHRGRVDRQVKVRGMRIEPGEIEAAVASLREVAEVVVTTAPGQHGARVVAHVVGGAGIEPDPAAIRRALRASLPPHLVPSAIVAHPSFPRTPSGKVDHEALDAPGSAARPGPDPEPVDPFERALAALWCELLEIEGPIRSDDEFFDLGGHSMLAVELSVAVEERLGRRMPLAQLFETPSLGELARVLRGDGPVGSTERSAVRIRRGETGVTPLFWVPGLGGTVVSLYHLGRLLDRAQPLYGLEAVGHRPGEEPLGRIEDLAAVHLASVRALEPDGPYLVAGHSFGGLVAYEMACRLVAEGAEVAGLIVVDSWPPDVGAKLRSEGVAPGLNAVSRRPSAAEQRSVQLTSVNEASKQALRRYRPGAYPGDLVLLATAARREAAGDPTLGWSALVGGRVEVREVAGEHAELVGRTGSDGVAAVVNELLRPSGAGPTARRLLRLVRPRRGA